MLTAFLGRSFLSPELERIVQALYEREEGEPKHRLKWDRTYIRLFEGAAARLPSGCSREQLHDAILQKFWELKKSKRRQFPFVPPKA